MTAHFRALVFVPSLRLLAQSAAPPRFEAIQPDLLSTGGTLVNAAADFDGDVDLFVGFNGTANRYRIDRGVLVDAAGALGLADARSTRAAARGDVNAAHARSSRPSSWTRDRATTVKTIYPRPRPHPAQ